MFNNTEALFDDIVDAKAFYLTFSRDNSGTMAFDLSSARLEVFGTPTVAAVPEPASLALVGLSLAGLFGVRRLRKTNAG